MGTWDDWSDFDINLAVAKGLGFVVSKESHWHSAVEARGDDGYHAWLTLDYCNNWNDIGPIIERNNITIACYDGEWSAFSGFRPWADTDIRDNETHCKNIKRAAAIVFLIMNGVNPD